LDKKEEEKGYGTTLLELLITAKNEHIPLVIGYNGYNGMLYIT
jgi:hypothetical protein